MANKDFKVKNGLDIQSPLPISMGGTGQTSSNNTLNALLPVQTSNSGKYLTTDGTNASWATVGGGSNLPLSGGTMTGIIVGSTNTGGSVVNSNDSGSLSIRGDASNSATISFHRPNLYAINMGLDTDNNFKIGGWSSTDVDFSLDPSGNLTLAGTKVILSGAGSIGNINDSLMISLVDGL